jgi:hypothetical protein
LGVSLGGFTPLHHFAGCLVVLDRMLIRQVTLGKKHGISWCPKATHLITFGFNPVLFPVNTAFVRMPVTGIVLESISVARAFVVCSTSLPNEVRLWSQFHQNIGRGGWK